MTLEYLYYFNSLYTSLLSCKSRSKRSSHFTLQKAAEGWAFLWKAVSDWFINKSMLFHRPFMCSCTFSVSHLEVWSQDDILQFLCSFCFSILFINCVYTAHRTMAVLILEVRGKGQSITKKLFLKPNNIYFERMLLLKSDRFCCVFIFKSLNPQAFSCPGIVFW